MKRSLIILGLIMFFSSKFTYAGDTTSLISYWLFDDDTTTTADGYGTNTLTENGTITSVAGQFTNAHLLNAANEYWSVADNASLSITSDFSLLLWLNMDTHANANAVSFSKDDAEYVFRVNTSGNLVLRMNSTDVTASTGALGTGSFAHAAVTFDNTEDAVRYYIAGALDTTVASVTAAPTDGANDFTIGDGRTSYGDIGTNVGRIDEAVLFKRELTAAEVDDIRLNGIVAFAAGARSRIMMVSWLPNIKEAFAQDAISVTDADVKTTTSIANKIKNEFGVPNIQVESSPQETRMHVFKDGKRVTTFVPEWTEGLLPGDTRTPRKFSLKNRLNAKDVLRNWIEEVKSDERMR